VYRQAIDRALSEANLKVSQDDRYNLEMSFSRGLYTGWFRGIDNQELVHARFGKKRGVYLGEVRRIRDQQITIQSQAPVKPGDGVVFDNGHPEAKEEGGRVYEVEQRGKQVVLSFGRDALNLRRIQVGDKVWKTSDPEFDRQIRQTYAGDQPKFQRPIRIEVHGEIGQPLSAIARDEFGHIVCVESTMTLVEAHSKPLTTERLQEQFGRLGNTPFRLDQFVNHLNGAAMIPVSELNRLRREIVEQLEQQRSEPKQWQLNEARSFTELLPHRSTTTRTPELIVLVRSLEQLKTVLASGIQTVYCEFEDPRAYRQAVELARQNQTVEIWVAPPRITKPGENWILEQVRKSGADGYLVRNYDHLRFFQHDRCIGDFSLNIANALTADYFKHQFNLERLTASYDLNINQLTDLLKGCSSDWFEITIHQHMPMFHMEHCVFCAFLSEGTDYTNCGRPCEKHEVKLRLAPSFRGMNRTSVEHVLQADAGCRNTVFNGTAQTGAEFVQHLIQLGVHQFRIEFLNETPTQVEQIIQRYTKLIKGEISGTQLWQELKLQNQLGVTRGTLN
jgi:putative protease